MSAVTPVSSVSYVAGVGTCLPGEPIDNITLAKHIQADAEWISLVTGNRSRYFATDLDTGKVSDSLTDLCERAAVGAMVDAGVTPDAIDFVVLGTATPDNLMPSSANLVADRLGLNQIPTYQLQSGCTGAIQAFDVAARLLSDDRHSTGLVIGADVCVKHMDLNRDFHRMPPSELVNYVLFGDGAGAAVVTARPAGSAVAVRHVLNRFVGLGREPGQVISWFGLADRGSAAQAANEDYLAIERNVPQLAEEILLELVDETGWPSDEIDYLLPPQLSGRMTDRITKRLGLPAHEIGCVDETGNNGNALPFFQLERLLPRLGEGDRALCIAVESSKWIKGGLALEKVPAA